jgi:hypothetical protein
MIVEDDDGQPIDDLTGEEVVQLTMAAFLHMSEHNFVTDKELLEDILSWFKLMTVDIVDVEVYQIHDEADGCH